MPFLIEHITEVVSAIVVLVSLGCGALVALAITRRKSREKYFQQIDELRRVYSPVVEGLLTGRLDYARGLEALRSISGLDREHTLEQLCLKEDPPLAQIPILRQLCEDLGLVEYWRRQLAGEFHVASLREALARPDGLFQHVGRLRFLLRARAASNLGKIRLQPSAPWLLKALDDSHSDVQGAALRSLAAIRDPQSFPPLVLRLHEVILSQATHLSLRSIKTALLSFPLSRAPELVDSLRHKNGRIRFFATDIIREMVERERGANEGFILESKLFPPDLVELFLTVLCFDESPDVRARSASVISYLDDPRGIPALLALLEDSQWFVRLHAVRALGKRRFMSQASRLAQRLTDPHWMVREAAARAFLPFGQYGTSHLFEHFLVTPDRYTKEQIADEMQRTGIIPNLLEQYAQVEKGQEAQVISHLADMGKTSYLIAVLLASPGQGLARKFLQEFGHHPNPGIQDWVKHLAEGGDDPDLRPLARDLIRRPTNERIP
jgi:HEAT repeat protein